VRRRFIVAAVIGALVGGCSSGLTDRDKLVESLTLYTDAMRWQQWDQASNHLAPERRKEFLARHDELPDRIDVTDVEITRRITAPDGRVATVVVALSWLDKADPVVKKTVLEQRWELRGSSWVLGKERRLRGDPLPAPRRGRRPATQPASQQG
jgi:hypothetical protein